MSSLSRWIRLVPVLVLLLTAGLACRADDPDVDPSPGPSPSPAPAAASCQPDGGTLQLGCPSFPNTSPTAQPQWDYFAWNSFIAANWPALDPAANNQQRGFPDLRQSFLGAANTSLLVWETFKEKREVFLYPPPTVTDPGPWNQAPKYGPVLNPPPLCSDSQDRAATPGRFFGQGGKLVYDSLDETIEVGSEALEPAAALCRGYKINPCGKAGTPPDCSCVVGLPVAPRVWKGNPLKPNPQPVLYEVKVNYDFYKYVHDKNYYRDLVAESAAKHKDGTQIRLPFRTSAASQGYDSQACVANNYSKAGPGTSLTPCPIGSVHIKTAWIPLQNEDPSKYHTAEAAYFRTENGRSCMSYATFGLVGIHIIQRIHQGTSTTPQKSQGGTFIFATWEHVGNDAAGFTYANYLKGLPYEPPPLQQTFYPQPPGALPVARKYPILPNTRQVNSDVHAKIRAVNPNSVWLNYQLVGTQFQVIDINKLPPNPTNPNDPTGIGQPLYLANLVIETNEGLQHFQGLPPGAMPIAAPFNKVILPNRAVTAFNRKASNVAFSPAGDKNAPLTAYNMGGCMGCHGVAQVRGYSFSFVLFDGQKGADVDTQTSFDPPPVMR